MDDRLAVVQALFNEYNFHHLLVVNGLGKLVSVISERDLLKAISPNLGLAIENSKDTATLNKRVHQVMSKKLVSINENASLNQAIKTFKEQQVSCLPVINNDNKPVGIITWRDVVDWLYKKITR